MASSPPITKRTPGDARALRQQTAEADLDQSQRTTQARGAERAPATASAARVLSRFEPLAQEKNDLRAYTLDPRTGSAKQVDVHEQLRSAPAAALAPSARERDTTGKDVSSAVGAAVARRANDLSDLPNASSARSPVLPEDSSLKPTVAHMAVESDVDATLAAGAARVGLLEGFRVQVAGSGALVKHLLEDKAQRNVDVVSRAGGMSPWLEDGGEIHEGGQLTMGAYRPADTHAAIVQARVERLYPDLSEAERANLATAKPFELSAKYPLTAFAQQGGSSSAGAFAAMGAAKGQAVRQALGYLEGGNVIGFTRPDGSPAALVGKDSFAASRAALEEGLKRRPTDDEVRGAIAKDLGLKPSAVIAVEQPGAYHLDLAMKPLGPGHVLLNDAAAAHQQQVEHLRAAHAAARPGADASASARQRWDTRGLQLEEQLASLEKTAAATAKLEAMAARDLESAGLKVSRVAGRFPDPDAPLGSRDQFNFLNGELGRGRDGQVFFLTQGGPKALEHAFVKKLALFTDAPSRVYFGDRDASAQSLRSAGGINCRIKFSGTRVRPK